MSTSTNTLSRDYPRTFCLADDIAVEIGLLTPADGEALAHFSASLPKHDLLFARRDLSHPKVLKAWLEALESGAVTSLAARVDGELIGCTGVLVDPHSWSRHVGELRVVLAPVWRGRGLGRRLIQESFACALGLELEKLVVHMTVDQRASITVFEELGFRAEAVLRKHVKDRDGRSFDLAVLSHHVAEVAARHATWGITDALQG